MSDETYQQVCAILNEFIQNDSAADITLGPSVELESLGIDSVKYINLFLSLEDIIGKDLDEVAEFIDMDEIYTISDLVALVQELKAK